MKNKITMAAVLLSAALLASCDEHEYVDPSWHSWQPGMVYCTNGEVGNYEDCIAKGNTPEAVLFYVDADGEIDGKAYAVSLYESEGLPFSNPDTIYVAQGTSSDIMTYDGETNTTALRYGQIASPIANSLAPSYFIPSVADMYKLFYAKLLVNVTIEKCGGDTLPVDLKDCWYWTSTECQVAGKDRAWCFSLSSGRFESADKHRQYPTRPILTIRLNNKE